MGGGARRRRLLKSGGLLLRIGGRLLQKNGRLRRDAHGMTLQALLGHLLGTDLELLLFYCFFFGCLTGQRPLGKVGA